MSTQKNDRVAVVTGGSRGLGRVIAHDFAKRGFDVVVASRKSDACQKVAAEISEKYSVSAIGVACHVGHWPECDELIDRTFGEFGRLDALVNNAGMSPLYPSLAEVSEELYDKVLAVNLRGPFRLSVRAAAAMQSNGGGQIVNISSIAAVVPKPEELPYALAKSALNTLTVGLSRAYGPDVRVNAVMPGMFSTDVALSWGDTVLERANDIPLGRVGEPNEIVGAVRYLTSEESSYTTGAVIKVDGGMAWAPA
ncbi:glucose 1-dehydrogenase (plasmid) [Rhodococcus opacus]|uniref:SDR family NAD(P)-dependent oxidoreductase n=1 Tax=Rhodococcus opacus TaxID=37919 RepID=UPI0034D25D06